MDTVSRNLQPHKNSFECIAKCSKTPIWRHHRLCAFLRFFVHRSVCWWTVTIICLPISCYRDNIILKEVSNIMFFCDTYMHNKYVRFTVYNPICTDQHWMAIYLEWNCCPGPRATMRDKRERYFEWPNCLRPYICDYDAQNNYLCGLMHSGKQLSPPIFGPDYGNWKLAINQSFVTSRSITRLFSFTHKASLLKQLVWGI